jgi:hypothetical protein
LKTDSLEDLKMALQLLTHFFGPIPLAAAPPGGSPSHVEFIVTSSGGPFSMLGFYIDPAKVGPAPAGTVNIALSRINGSGVIHPEFQLADGMTVRPQDLVVSYGSVISSSNSVAFAAIQWPSSTGAGAAFNLYGRIVFLADGADTLAVTVAP